MDELTRSLPPLHHRTPLVCSQPLSARLGTPVHLKLEALQPTGSFKVRGIGNLCRKAVARGETRFVASSGGNAGCAVAHAARRLGAHATVVVPETTDARMQRLIAAEGAEVIVHGDVWDHAQEHALALLHARGGTYVSPFDHPDIWEGHATMVDELGEQLSSPPALIVVAVGGGGLLCGVMQGLRRLGGSWSRVPVLAVETAGAASLAAAQARGELVSLDRIDSIATSLGALRVTAEALRWVQGGNVRTHQVTDAAAVAACLRFADDHRLLVEPACGAALAPLYGRAQALREAALAQAATTTVNETPPGGMVVIVCGGAGVTLDKLQRWAEQTDARADHDDDLLLDAPR